MPKKKIITCVLNKIHNDCHLVLGGCGARETNCSSCPKFKDNDGKCTGCRYNMPKDPKYGYRIAITYYYLAKENGNPMYSDIVRSQLDINSIPDDMKSRISKWPLDRLSRHYKLIYGELHKSVIEKKPRVIV